eukprot:13404989-Alexandrium_andersonii.AAC.1
MSFIASRGLTPFDPTGRGCAPPQGQYRGESPPRFPLPHPPPLLDPTPERALRCADAASPAVAVAGCVIGLRSPQCGGRL